MERTTVNSAITSLQRYGWVFYDTDRDFHHTPRPENWYLTNSDEKKSRQTSSGSSDGTQQTDLTSLTNSDEKKSRQLEMAHSLKKQVTDEAVTKSDENDEAVTRNLTKIPPYKGEEFSVSVSRSVTPFVSGPELVAAGGPTSGQVVDDDEL